MKKLMNSYKIGLVVIIGLFLGSIGGFSQNKVCVNDTVKVFIDDYRGNASWEISMNGMDWTALNEDPGDTVSLLVNLPMFVRLEVIEGSCMPVYSDVMAIELHDPPVVVFESRDSACINERDFLLSGGLPEGGTYFGTGVSNNRFNPASAGVGVHNLSYWFTDPETTCSDTSYSQIEVFPLSSNASAGENMEMITSDSVYLQANTPDYGVGTWSIISGNGGHFIDENDPNTIFVKDSSDLNYVLRWTIAGPCSSDTDDINLGFLKLSINPCPGTPIVVDADGNIYRTVQMQDQCWMAENLRTGVFVESDPNGNVHSDLSNNGVIEKYCYENDTANCSIYGGLYDWDEAMGYSNEEGVQGVCPEGWHIPTNQDWADLDGQFKLGNAGEYLKETGGYGYGGQFAGDRHERGEFYSEGSSGWFWSSTTYSYNGADDGYFRKICACKRRYYSQSKSNSRSS